MKSIIWEGLMLYRQNPIIILPPIILAIVNLTTSGILSSLFLSSFGISSSDFSFLLIAYLLLFSLIVLATFLVILGQAVMTGRIVLEGHTGLGDWSAIIRNRFRVVLGLGIIFGSAFSLSSTASILLGVSLAAYLNAFSVFRMSFIIVDVVSSIPLSLFYIVLAPAIMEGKGIRDSMRHGWRAVRSGLGVYLPYLGTLIVLSLAISIISIPIEGSIAGIVTEVVRAVSTPLLFILAFLIYRNKRGALPSNENNELYPS